VINTQVATVTTLDVTIQPKLKNRKTSGTNATQFQQMTAHQYMKLMLGLS